MDLRDLKKEVQDLPSITHNITQFHEHWIKPLRSSADFLSSIPSSKKKIIKEKTAALSKVLHNLKDAEILSQKLHSYTRSLIDLKLTQLRNDHTKSRFITNTFLYDDYFNLRQTIHDIQSFDTQVQQLAEHYEEVNELLHQSLSLEEMLVFMEIPHWKYLSNLLQTAQRQKAIVRHIGRHFIALANQGSLKKVPHK